MGGWVGVAGFCDTRSVKLSLFKRVAALSCLKEHYCSTALGFKQENHPPYARAHEHTPQPPLSILHWWPDAFLCLAVPLDCVCVWVYLRE